MDVSEQKIDIKTQDGRVLAGLLVKPEKPSVSVLVSPAVAIPKERYLAFAREGAARGAAVLLYDYRSQAGSALPDLTKDLACFSDWGRRDMTAAIRHLDGLHPALEMVSVGHSAGGWILGLADNHSRFSRHTFLCVGWGYWKLKPLGFRSLEMFFWHIYGPLCLKLYGHIPKGGAWKGEPLNPKLFAEWKRWCHMPTCEASVLAGGANQPHFYEEITAPIRSFAYRDDPIANERSVPLLLSLFSKAKHETVWASPEDFGLRKIGHEGFLSRKAAKTWEPIWNWVLPTAAS
jgi:predicted alpha/beta hydrolase